MNPGTYFFVFVFSLAGLTAGAWVSPLLALSLLAIVAIVALSLQKVDTWQKFVILRINRSQNEEQAGMLGVVPVIDAVIAIVNTRSKTTGFNAERVLSRDTDPGNIDAIVFWHVHIAENAAPAIRDYRQTIDQVAQTSLRAMLDASMREVLPLDHDDTNAPLPLADGQNSMPWRVTVSAVEVRDITLLEALRDRMSRQDQVASEFASEKHARIIFGSAEAAIDSQFVSAAETAAGALQVRAMNIIYETTKERGTMILIPSSTVDSLNPTSRTLALALAGKAVPGSVASPRWRATTQAPVTNASVARATTA
ncbi:MAG: SPFH domain-containing protein [Nevskia sp.]|jgi:regulator of protease activity HflC (stomatin/prohibitin superfamily)|nr:SPFH domain-containing protein [Nevskia sp.]MCK9386491.1 SPFH domain-containing protein [Nevskia sp.]